MKARALPTRARASLPLVCSIAGALGSALSLLAGSRLKLLPDITAYGAGMAVGSVTSAVLAGGMSLAFVTGSDSVRADVLTARRGVVIPALLAASTLAALAYSMSGPLPGRSVLCGGITVAGNLLAELDASLLQRVGRLGAWTAVTVVTRLAPPIFIVLFHSYAMPIAVSTLVYALALGVLARGHRPSLHGRPHPLRAFRNSYHPGLATFSWSDALALRLPLIAAPATLAPTTAGVVTTLVSSQQTVVGVLGSALYGSMAAQQNTADDAGVRAHRRFDRLLTWLSVALAVLGALLAPVLLWVLHLPQEHRYWLAWALLCAAVPFATATRRQQYANISRGRPGPTTRSAVLSAVCVVLACGMALMINDSGALQILCGCTLLAEAAAFFYLFTASRQEGIHD